MAPITEVALHKRIIDVAIKAGVKRILLSEFGTNVPELQTTEPAPIYDGKVEIREYMKAREGQGLTWTALVVGAFFDWFAAFAPSALSTSPFSEVDAGVSMMVSSAST